MKAWNVIDKLKSDLSDDIKRYFFRTVAVFHTTIKMHHMDTNKRYRQKAGGEQHKNTMRCLE